MRHPGARRLVASELADHRKPKPPATDPSGAGGLFVDSHGVEHPLDPGLRDRLKPGWRTMTDPVAAALPPTDEAIRARTLSAAKSIADASALLASATDIPLAGRILEVGCYDGAVAWQLAGRDGTEVVASDLASYYVAQRPDRPAASAVERQLVALDALRERARVAAGATVGSVAFVEDDVTESRLQPGSFDAIVSFEVLEHVRGPEGAFASMTRLLKPGGLLYHDYNPFFSIIGGHSLCTLDFPWGHASLDAADFERYLREIRPGEAEQAGRFYSESLNRLTLADLRVAIRSSRLDILAIEPWPDRSLLSHLSPTTLGEVRRAYPTAALDDLLATFVTVVARRPADAA
jgi:SAM-dependent methyltransferase